MNLIDGIPMEFSQVNIIQNMMSPSTTHCSNNLLVNFLEMYLIQKAMSVFKFTLPDEIDERYFKWCLFCNGWIVLTYDDTFGPLAHYASLKEQDMYYRPKKAEIILTDTDPMLTRTINRILVGSEPDAVLMTLQENYRSILDIICFFAERMALIYEAFDVNVINSHLAYVFGTDKKSIAETFKKVYDEISGGSPAAVMDKDLFDEDGKPKWTTFINNLKQNYIGSELMLDLSKIEREFDTWIGIPSANTDKRERLTNDEVNSNNVESISMISMWLQNMQECIERVKKYCKGYENMSVELRFDTDDLLNKDPEEGGFEDGQF